MRGLARGSARPASPSVGAGRRMELYKEVGLPSDVAEPLRAASG